MSDAQGKKIWIIVNHDGFIEGNALTRTACIDNYLDRWSEKRINRDYYRQEVKRGYIARPKQITVEVPNDTP